MKTKYGTTEGPWLPMLDKGFNVVYSQKHERGICQIQHDNKNRDEHNANTKLIAASPELLEIVVELKWLIGASEVDSDRAREAFIKAGEIIKKATE